MKRNPLLRNVFTMAWVFPSSPTAFRTKLMLVVRAPSETIRPFQIASCSSFFVTTLSQFSIS
jgi:hypothetical protein